MDSNILTFGIIAMIFQFIMILFAITAGYYVLKILMLYPNYLKLKIQDLQRKNGTE